MDEAVKITWKLICDPRANAHLERVKRHICESRQNLSAEYARTDEPVAYAERKNLVYKPLRRNESWAEKLYDCAWIHFYGKINQMPQNALGVFDFGGEGCVWDDNGVVQGLTSVLSQVDFFQTRRGKKTVDATKLSISPDGTVDVWVDAGWNGVNGVPVFGSRFNAAFIAEFRQDVFAYYYDYWTVYQYSAASDSKVEKEKYATAMRTARRLLKDFSPEAVAAARAALSRFFEGGNENPLEVTAVGHAHLDLAWMWPMRETKRKAERTYSNALANIEKYPDYIFGSSQPQQFEWMKERRPELYQKIKTAVANGRIEPQGCMWCEPDTNIPSGESLIRQCYFGKKFFMDEFGKKIDYLWVPDVFGYSASLPRILRGCGVDKFMTIKLSWNTVNKFPHHSFVWKGIGEGDLLVHMPPEGNYNSCATPYCLKMIARDYREKALSHFALMPYGCGDGGAGPGEFHINIAERDSKFSTNEFPRVKLDTAEHFFEKLQTEREMLPHYEGELYLEKHQGTYTTQSRMKRDMRRAEVLLHNAEFLCSAAALNNGAVYPAEVLDEIWKNVLLHQFHDILPGSSIKRVYDEAHAVFVKQEEVLNKIAENALGALCHNEQPSVINATSFARKGYVNTGNSWKQYSAAPYSSAVLEDFEGVVPLAKEGVLENECVRVQFDADGEISALVDKNSGENYACGKLNTMRVYTDKNMVPYGAWDIDIGYPKKPSKVMKLVSSRSYVDGVCAVREQVLTYGKSKLVQKIKLYPDCPVVFFENEADWHEKCKMLRADFRPAHFSETVKCDIQMGSFDRSTKNDTSVEYAQFEICAHKWVDVSDDKGGFALLNDCKYGHRVKEGLVSLNLLRSTIHPDKTADRGSHSFTYAIYPHKGAALESDLVKYAYFLNNPEIVAPVELPSLVETSDGVVAETVLVTPAGELAVRVYETDGKPREASLAVGFSYESVRATNLLFEGNEAVDLTSLSFTPFEIKTIVFVLKEPLRVK